MSSQITHLLTLLAFATHVVMGCCAHHGHGSSDICCQSGADFQSVEHSNVARLSPTEASCTSSHDCCGHQQPNLARRHRADSSSAASHNDCGQEQKQLDAPSSVELCLVDTHCVPP
ncbi:MAG: hypothetical protein KDA72_07220, partial [Planctomycetales bacterium]|nr:hypothetical protein [Planctomycetales bacterium]